jgi:phosphoribosylanthranilate isomerase
MTWIKICGITNLQDALAAVEAGADAVGFVFYEKSPRKVDAMTAATIISQLPERIEKVGVFVDGSGCKPMDIAREAGLTAIQNTVGPGYVADPESEMMVAMGRVSHPPKLFLAFPANWIVTTADKLEKLPARDGSFDTFFLDSGTREQPGGTGTTFAWQEAASAAKEMQQKGFKLVVAGGLTPANVAGAMDILKPWGVDVSSGVEASPGKKDPEKVRAFVKAVRDADKRLAG